MALRMASPWKSKTGTYWFRKAVPHALRDKVGKTILHISLRTKDPKEAKNRFLRVAAEVAEQWEALGAVRPALTQKQTQGLAGEFYRWMIAKHDENPGRASDWREKIERDGKVMLPSGGRPSGAVGLYLPQVKEFLTERGIGVDDNDLYELALAVSKAGVQAKEALERRADGDYSPDPKAERFPKWEEVEPKITVRMRSLTVAKHFTKFADDCGLSQATRKRWRPALENLAEHIQDDNLVAVTPALLLTWKEKLRGPPSTEPATKRQQGRLSPRTIRDVYFASGRSFFEWAKENHKLTRNPFDGMRIRVPKGKVTRNPSLSDDEARIILTEAMKGREGRESEEYGSAKRWIPWVCCYTGARVNEITQMRCMDLKKVRIEGEDVWVLHITPDAGSVKNLIARDVPLHPHLVEMGFPEFVQRRGSGDMPVFYNPSRRRNGTEQNPQNKKVAEKLAAWVREMGSLQGDDPTLQHPDLMPNHGWRHRFNNVARRAGMDPEVRDGIKGHAPRTEGEKYGGVIPIEAKWAGINRLKRFTLDEAD